MNTPSIGFIGLGLMGEAMAHNIVKKSKHPLWVYDLNTEAMDRLVAAGAKAAQSIVELTQKTSIIISMVPRSEHVQAIYKDMLPHLTQGQITIDMSTIDPAVSIALSQAVAKTGAVMLDAPVVKSVPAAKAGELGIYIGGDKAAYDKVKPILALMGSNQIHLGDNGRGLIMKVLHNVLVAQIQNSVNEMLCTADFFGIDKHDFNTAVSYGGGSNFYLTSKIDTLIAENYSTAFSMNNMAKDIGIMTTLVEEAGLNLPGVELVKTVYDIGLERGLGNEDFCATYKVVAKNLR